MIQHYKCIIAFCCYKKKDQVNKEKDVISMRFKETFELQGVDYEVVKQRFSNNKSLLKKVYFKIS